MFQLESVSLRGNGRWRLHRITQTFPQCPTAVIGYSGAGKSSLLNLLVGYEQPDQGRIQRPGDTAGSALRLPFFWVPQSGGLWPHLTVRQHLLSVQSGAGSLRADFPYSADEILDQFALSHLAHARPSELSLGECSRLATARGLAAAPAWLIMDEPLSHVDPVRKPAFWHAIRALALAAGISLIFSCHEPDVVLRQASLAVCLHQGEIAYSGPVRDLYEAPPTADLGRFLGPLNWWTPAEVSRLQNSAVGLPANTCIRPHRMRLQPDVASELHVVAAQHCGLYSETLLQPGSGPPLAVLHQHSAGCLQPGTGVTLHLEGGA
ncbi:MAG: ATP-binding cassette domain-containing protein [Planctomycetota bacterium]